MREMVKLGLTLMIICAVAAGSLAYVNGVTSVIIADRLEREKLETLKALFPAIDKAEDREVDGMAATVALDSAGNVIGVMAEGTAEGYGGTIQFTLAVGAEGEIVSVSNIRHSETPGLGARITEEAYLEKFKGKTAEDPFSPGQDVDLIGGASISSRAMASGVKQTLQDITLRFAQ